MGRKSQRQNGRNEGYGVLMSTSCKDPPQRSSDLMYDISSFYERGQLS